MALEKEQRPTDFVYEQFGVKLVVDEDSIELLNGAVVDFEDGVMESGFKIDNPNAVFIMYAGIKTERDENGNLKPIK